MGAGPQGAAGPLGVHGEAREKECRKGRPSPVTQARYSVSLSLRFFICKMGTTTRPTP